MRACDHSLSDATALRFALVRQVVVDLLPGPDVARSVTENQSALQAARQRCSEGATNFLDVTATQAQLLQSDNDLSDSDTLIATDLVNLYRALGGGWEVADVAHDADSARFERE